MALQVRRPLVEDVDMKNHHIYWSSAEEGRAMFDRQAHELVHMSGDEFIQRWDAGEFRDIADTAGHRHILRLASLIPFGRPDA
jgi:hypothetical protein